MLFYKKVTENLVTLIYNKMLRLFIIIKKNKVETN